MIGSGKCSGRRERVVGVQGCGRAKAAVFTVVARKALGGKVIGNQGLPGGKEIHLHHMFLRSLKSDLQTHRPVQLGNEYRLFQKGHQSKLPEFGDIATSDSYRSGGCDMKQINRGADTQCLSKGRKEVFTSMFPPR